MTDDLSEFFRELAKEKKQKKEEFNELVGDLNLDSIFSEVSSLKKESKKKKVEEKKAIKAFEEFLFSEEESVEKEEKAEEAIREWIEDPVEEIVEEPEVESEPEEDLIEKSLGLLAEPEPEQQFATLDDLSKHYKIFIDRIQQQLSTLGGGGEVRLEFLDDVDRDSVKVDGKFLKYQASTGKFIGADASGGGGDSEYASSAGIATEAVSAGIATFATSSGIATEAISAGIATYATSAGIATEAVRAGLATEAVSAGIATFATIAGIASNAYWVQTASGIHTTSNVGLGLTNPLVSLHMFGSYPTLKIQNSSTDQYASASIDLQGPAGDERYTKILHGNSNSGGTETYFQIEQYDSSGSYVKTLAQYGYQYDYWAFNTGGTERLRINSSGNVGIRTDNPQEKLHVHEGDVVIGQDSGNNTKITNFIKFGRVDAPKAAIGFVNNRANGRGDIIFMSDDDGNSSAFDGSDERVRITSSGLVGIGTSGPSQELEVFSDDFTGIRLRSSRTAATDQIGGVGFSTVLDQVATINALVDGTVLVKNTTSDTERVRITSSGNIEIADGNLVFSTSGTGINLGNETLDQYDEGTFTPSYQTANNDISNVNYDAQAGHYTRIGNMCYFIMRLRTSSIGNVGSGTLEVHGLPFTHVNNASNRAVVLLTTSGWTDGDSPTLGFFHQNTNTFKLTQKSASQDPTNLSSSVLNTSGDKNEIRVTGMYRCI